MLGRSMIVCCALVGACGDDGTSGALPDASSAKLSIDPATITLAAGETVTAAVRIDHVVEGADLRFVIIGEAADVIVSDGTIPVGASSTDITLAATPTAAPGSFTITAMGIADSDVTAGTARVTVVGQAGTSDAGSASGDVRVYALP